MADIQFEHIDPYVEGSGGDTGLTSRQKLRRNFEKIKAWMDSVASSLASWFLRKDQEDTAHEKITFEKGADFGMFSEGSTGAGLWQDGSGNWHCEADFLHARKKLTAKELQIEEVTHIGGAQLLTAASMLCDFVVDKTTHWRCFFLKTDGSRQVTNKWKVNDQAYVNTFNLTGNHFLWRLVTGTSNTTPDNSTYIVGGETYDASKYHYIDLSKSSCATDSAAPQAGDHIVQLGYQGTDSANADRQNAIMEAGAGTGSPYIREYTGINSFTLPSPETQLKPGANKFSGEVNMSANSTLGGSNIQNIINDLSSGVSSAQSVATAAATAAQTAAGKAQDAADDAQSAQTAADTAGARLDALSTGNENLVVNGGFTGLYESDSVEGNTTVNTDTEIFSDPFGRWSTHSGCEIVTDVASATGQACQLTNGQLQQTISRSPVVGQPYTLSLLALSSGSVIVSVAGYSNSITLTAGERSEVKFTASSSSKTLIISGSGTITEIQLIQGNVTINDWTPSPEDNNKFLSYYKNFAYLMQAIDNASTTVLGGLVLTQAIRVGNYANKVMTQETGGMSGNDAGAEKPFLWGGGSLTQALNTIAAYANDPTFQPTSQQLANMAKFVVTHGGRAILNDIIMRGIVYATGGKFTGKDGMFKIEFDAENLKISINGPSKVSDTTTMEPYSGASEVEYLEIGSWGARPDIGGGAGYFISPAITMKSVNSLAETIYKLLISAPNGLVFTDRNDNVLARYSSDILGGTGVNLFFLGNLPTDPNNCSVGQVYRDGSTLKIKTS